MDSKILDIVFVVREDVFDQEVTNVGPVAD